MTKTILLVDDDAHILETAEDILEAAGYAVQTSETGKMALEKLKANAAQLMIVDLNLVDTTGLELAVQAKALRPDLIVILMTGEASVDLGPAASAIHSILTKPVDPGALIDLIRKVLN